VAGVAGERAIIDAITGAVTVEVSARVAVGGAGEEAVAVARVGAVQDAVVVAVQTVVSERAGVTDVDDGISIPVAVVAVARVTGVEVGRAFAVEVAFVVDDAVPVRCFCRCEPLNGLDAVDASHAVLVR